MSFFHAQTLDHFFAKKFPNFKRYSGEGAESMLVFAKQYLSHSCSSGVEQAFIGLPHRARNNLLVNELNFPLEVCVLKKASNRFLFEKEKLL